MGVFQRFWIKITTFLGNYYTVCKIVPATLGLVNMCSTLTLSALFACHRNQYTDGYLPWLKYVIWYDTRYMIHDNQIACHCTLDLYCNCADHWILNRSRSYCLVMCPAASLHVQTAYCSQFASLWKGQCHATKGFLSCYEWNVSIKSILTNCTVWAALNIV